VLPGSELWPLVERRAADTPEALFAVDEDGRRLDFAGYRDAALRCAAGLAARGLGEGSVVSWQLPTRLGSLVLAAALARLGCVQNPILPILRERELRFITGQARSQWLVVPDTWRGVDHAALAEAVAADAEGLAVLVLDGALPEGDPAALGPPPVAGDAVRWLFYTSGTTAEPKGVRHTDAGLAAAGRGMAEALALRADDRVAFVFPVTHVGGVNWLFAGLMAGCAHVVVPAFDPQRSPAVLARHGVTQATAGTVFHQAYLAAQRARPERPLLPAVRAFPGGGAPKPPELHFAVKRELGGAGVVSGYGATECPIATMNRVDDPDEKKAHTEGRATPGTRVRIAGEDGRTLAPGEEGEIRVCGPQLFRGYVDASLDAAALDADGFFRTGDLGRLDAEGFLTVTGRLKDVIIRKGENISAKEVEDSLFAHPKLADVAVVGLPDPEAGERCCAVVVPADPADPPDLAEVAAFLASRGLARQKIPERLEVVASLPRNPAGKVLKRELRARYGAPTSGTTTS
jgi:acyl-CoA synthetase (AMP-forming)/AMP-acid ligase II